MRKNLAKHTAKKLPLAKRVLALCFALIFVCSCLLPAFANGTGAELETPDTEVVEAAAPGTEPEPMDLYDEPVAVADEPEAMDDDFGVADEPAAMDDQVEKPVVDDEPAAMDDQVEKPVVDDEPAAMDDQVEKPVVDDEPAAMDDQVEKPVEGGEPPVADDTPAKEGATKTTTDASGNTVYEYDTSGTTFPDDDAAALPDGDQMQVDAAFSIPTNIYHFWLKKMSSYDLADIADAAKTAEMTVEQYLAMYGTEKGCYHIMTAADGANLKDYQFANPTSNDDPEGNSRTFAGWYYTDELGDEQKFVFDEHLYVSESTTVEVYAKWKDEAAEKTEKYKGWYNELLNASDDYTLESLATEYFNDEGFKEYLATLSEDEYVKLAKKLEIETYTDFTYEMDEDEDEYGIALLALGPDSDNNQKVVYVGGTATLKSNKGVYNYGHQWTSSNTNIATVSSRDTSGNQTYKATVTGVRAGTVVITHTFTDYWGNVQKDTVTLQVTDSSEDALSSYYLYCYTLIPGKTVNSSGTPDSVWNGMGVGSITGLGKPGSDHQDKVVLDNGYGSTAGVMITYPTEYPDITYGETTYKYAKTEEEKYKAGFYTITWFRVVQDNGANAGKNGYNPVVNTANYPYNRTYHLDGQITLNEKDIVAIDFKLKDARSSTFELVDPETFSFTKNNDKISGKVDGNTNEEAAFINTYTANKLEVIKEVTGAAGDKNYPFSFTVTFTGPDGKTWDASKLTFAENAKSADYVNNAWNFTLTHGESISFANLPKGVTYSVVEKYLDAANQITVNDIKYTARYENGTGTMDADPKTATVYNATEGFLDTGVILDNAPYMLMLAVVAGGAMTLVIKKRREEE